MARLGSWKTLNEGRSDEVILAVDFALTARPESSFPDLIPKLDPGLTFWETVPPPVAVDAGMTADQFMDRWLDECRAAGRPVRAVLGYCVGSMFAAVMADRIGEWQAKVPQLIVIDPEPVLLPALYHDFLRSAENLATILSAGELAEAREAGLRAWQEYGEDFAALGGALVRIIQEPTASALARLGLDRELRDEFIGAFGSYVAYLIAARQIDPMPALGRATAITSSMSSGAASLAAKEIRFDVDHHVVLRDDRVAQAISDVLRGVHAAA